jgi:hypothetical protein
MAKETKTFITNGAPIALNFEFNNWCPRLAINAFNTDDPTDKYYWRLVFEPEKECNIRFPVTPKNLTVEFVSDNPFFVQSTLRYDCQPRNWIELPEKKSIRPFEVKDIKLVWVDDIPNTPAKIFVGHQDFPLFIDGPNVGQIWCSRKARARMAQQQFAMIIDHEIYHTFTDSEEEADAGAFLMHMKQGYSISQAYYALVMILGRDEADMNRKMNLWRIAHDFNEKYN